MTITRGQDPFNRSLTIHWTGTDGPKNFQADCPHEYNVTLWNAEILDQRITQVIPGVFFTGAFPLALEISSSYPGPLQ